MIERSSVFLLAIVLGAVGIWLASPHAPLIRQRRTAGWILASLSLLLLAWQLPRDTDNITGVLSLIVSATLPATAAGTIVIEQTRNAAGCFGLLLLAVFALFLLIGAWPMALVVTLLLVAAFSAEKFMPAENKQSWFDISRETDSWEPMLASAVGAVVVGVLAMPISRVGVGDASATAHNMAIAGVLLLGIGLVGLISRASTARMFLAVGVMLAGATVAALGWIGTLDGAMLPIAIVAGLVGGIWIVAAMLLIRLGDESDQSPTDKQAALMNTRLYALLTAVGLVVLAGILRMGG